MGRWGTGVPRQLQTLLNLPHRPIVMECHRAVVQAGVAQGRIDVLALALQQARGPRMACAALIRGRFEFADNLVQQTGADMKRGMLGEMTQECENVVAGTLLTADCPQ